MDILDSIALWGRRYQQQSVPRTGGTRFGLADLLEMFDRSSILELSRVVDGKEQAPLKPDPVRKLKISLLDDGVSALQTGSDDWYEVYRTPPSGDLSKVRVLAHSAGGQPSGEIRMLLGRRSYEHYFEEDPILEQIRQRASNN
ncbi:MAG TPA: hypothetical protein VH951_01560 [Dehalococcoidia bacterium]